ncbi:thioredoxin fold domain-containing protein [Flavobacterium sp. NST-5]|uniref:Thioredoxin fold domain-containing protein n=1 Tax=Flavobacterium ichthyis TaxID=2698827 RepID=A0ABW9Z6T6_9FLAO|nr:thioredoxin family protein [Flavobacterium ichthyis]NBL64583.1 thioredoxin fold domain-containing protein [Flavobacterium ichthyis]
MKKLIVLFFIAIGSLASVQAQEIKWMTLDQALAAQKKKAKPIFMDVYTDWCGPCKMLDKNTFQTKEVADYINANYYAVKFNGEGNSEVTYKGTKYGNPKYDANRKGRNAVHDFTIFLKVQGYPSMYIFDKKGELKAPIVGYHTAEQLLPLLKV